MSAVWMRGLHELRTRWRGAVVLALLFGVAGGFVMTAAAGARRTDAAYDRLLRSSRAYDVEVQIQDDTSPEILDSVAALPQVADHARLVFVPGTRAEPGAERQPFSWDVTTTAIVDRSLATTFEIPKVLAGRRPDYGAANEAVVNEKFLRAHDLAVGDDFPLQLATFDELLRLFEGRPVPPTAPILTVRIVGVWRIPHDVSIGEQSGILFLTPAFVRAYQDRAAMLWGVFVRLREGSADVPSFVEAAKRIGSEETLGFQTSLNHIAKVDRALGVQSSALWILAAAVGVAALLILGQALGRWLTLGADDQGVLQAMGMGRRHRANVVALPAVAVAVAASAIGVASGIAFSPLVPIGFARSIEPDRGVFVDGLMLGIGAAVLIGVVSAWGAVHAWRLSRSRAPSDAGGRTRPSAVAQIAAESGMPPAVVTGIRFGLEPGRGRSAVPVRSVLMATALSIVAVTGAFVFSRNLDALLATPASYGWNWDLVVAGGEGDPDFVAEVEGKLRASRHVDEFARVKIATTTWRRNRDLETLGLEPVVGSITTRVLEGRYPVRDDEVALATRTLREARLRIGDRATFPGSADACAPRRACEVSFRIVGRTVHWGEGSDPDDGAAFTSGGQDRVRNSEGFDDFLVRIPEGDDVTQAKVALTREFGQGTVMIPRLPTNLLNVERVRTMPAILVAVLALLAVAALIHALVTVSRRRRYDLAILKTMGFVRGQVMAALAWQATALILIALAVGIPVGLVAGRWVWRSVAEELGVSAGVVAPVALLAITAAATLVLANLVALIPGRAAARTKPALVLRTE